MPVWEFTYSMAIFYLSRKTENEIQANLSLILAYGGYLYYLPSTITEACQTTFSILCQVWVNNGPKTVKRQKSNEAKTKRKTKNIHLSPCLHEGMWYGRKKSEMIDNILQQADELHCSPKKVCQEGQAPWWLAPVIQDLTWETIRQTKKWAGESLFHSWIIIIYFLVETLRVYLFIYSIFHEKREG